MAKLKQNSIQTADFIEYLNSYSDFSFELSVLKKLREYGIECEHGGHYEDPVTSKSREFDIRATKSINKYRVRMPIECKNIRENFPILISCVPRHLDEAYHQVALVNEPSSERNGIPINTIHQSRAHIYSIREQYSLYKISEPVGKSTVQIGRGIDNGILTNDSELYEKWGQCLSSANDLVRRIYWDGSENDDDYDSYSSAIIPFVVVPNERLWIVTYDEDGNRIGDPEMTNRVSCFINKDYRMGNKFAGANMLVSHVEIVTFNGLRKPCKTPS